MRRSYRPNAVDRCVVMCVEDVVRDLRLCLSACPCCRVVSLQTRNALNDTRNAGPPEEAATVIDKRIDAVLVIV